MVLFFICFRCHLNAVSCYSPDIGEDVIQFKEIVKKKHKIPGQSLVFGDLFELKKGSKNTHTTTLLSHSVRGPSQCLIYIRKFFSVYTRSDIIFIIFLILLLQW